MNRYTDANDGPEFSAVYIGLLKMVGNVMMLVGIVIYSRYLSTWEYKKIFTYMQVVSWSVIPATVASQRMLKCHKLCSVNRCCLPL